MGLKGRVDITYPDDTFRFTSLLKHQQKNNNNNNDNNNNNSKAVRTYQTLFNHGVQEHDDNGRNYDRDLMLIYNWLRIVVKK